ncbi:MAG: ABC transporter permease [Candidatus Acidiferrales bacterium]
MFLRLIGESFARNPRRQSLTVLALVLGMAVATSTLGVALDVGDRLAREFRSLGANLLVTPKSDTLPLEIGGVDYRPVDEGAYLSESDLGQLKMIFWRHNILGFTPFLDVPVELRAAPSDSAALPVTLVGTWYSHDVRVPDGTSFNTGASVTHPWWKIRGRWFSDGSKEAVVGAALAARNPRLAPGATVFLLARGATSSSADSAIPVVITGVVSTGGSEDNSVLAPLAIAQDLSGNPGKFRQLFVSALTKPEDALAQRAQRNFDSLSPADKERWSCSPYISSISSQIEQVLPDTDVRPLRQVADTEGRILSRVGLLLWIVTIAALVTAALGVAATSAATVIERRTEVGLMKALGATNFLVIAIFLGEQLILALAGGLAGYVVGLGLAHWLGRSVFGVPPAPRLLLLPIVLGFAVLVALIGSLIPLNRAARFEPAVVLRGE